MHTISTSPLALRSLIVAAVALLISLPGCNPPTLIVGNAVVQPDGRTNLEGYVHRRPMFPFLQDIEGAHVEFFFEKQPTLASSVSDKEGTAQTPGTIPPAIDQPLQAVTRLDGRTIYASAPFFRWQSDRNIIVVDIDNTICHSEVRKILGMKRPTLRPIEDSKETLQRLSADFHILYVTARPRRVLERSRKWLEDHGFPAGPVLTAPGLLDKEDLAPSKIKNIMRLKKIWPNILIGLGNKASDAKAYAECGMLAIIVRPQVEDAHGDYAIFMPTWYTVDQFFKTNFEVLKDAEAIKQVIAGQKMLDLRVIPLSERPLQPPHAEEDEK